MVFSSLLFLLIFLPITLILYFVLPKQLRNVELMIMSLIFYGWGEPIYIVLMLFSILINYGFGLLIDRFENKKRVIGLVFSVIINISLLIVFKYADLAIGTYNIIFGKNVELLNIALPIGISFYTFQAMSYVIDVYRRKVPGNKNIIEFATYITMFPQLIAGPIVRYKTVQDELKHRQIDVDTFYDGVVRFICGLGKKVLIANNVGHVFDEVASMSPNLMSTSAAWLGVIAFSLQIYFDFSGYSDMAIGMGKMFGFHFLENFDYPYESKSITEFWRKWHISLGTWFREYVYYPLGGNRKGTLRQLLNIAIVWMLTGLWHGASWNFVLWGVYYATLLVLEKLFLGKILEKIPAIFSRIYTLFAVASGWAIFMYSDVLYGKDFAKALLFHANQGIVDRNTAYNLVSFGILLIVATLGATKIPKKIAEKVFEKRVVLKRICLLAYVIVVFGLSVAYLVSDTYNPFLYFRF